MSYTNTAKPSSSFANDIKPSGSFNNDDMGGILITGTPLGLLLGVGLISLTD